MKKISKILALVLTVVLAVAMFAACGKKEEPTPAPAGSGSGSGSGSGNVFYGEYTGPAIELLVSPSSSSNDNCIYLIKALDRIKARTDGKVTYKLKLSGAGFSSVTAAADELAAGLVDIGDITLSNNPSYFPYTNQACGQPFLGFQDIFTANDIIREVIITNPNELMEAEFNNIGIKPILTSANFGNALAMVSDADVSNPEGLKGQRIQTDNELFKGILRTAGGTEAQLDVNQMVDSLDNHRSEGVFNSVAMLKIFNIASLTKGQSHAKYLYTFGSDMSTSIKTTCISQVTWDKFDDTLKNIFTEEMGDALYEDFVDWVHTMEDEQWEIFAKNGEPIVKSIEGENLEAWKKVAEPTATAQLDELRKTAPEIDKAIEIWKNAIDTYYASK